MSEHKKPTVLQQALICLEIIKLIPSRRSVTATEIQNSLELSGFHIETLTLQRLLKSLREEPSLGIECNETSKPFSYRRKNRSAFSDIELTPDEALLMRLVEKHMHTVLPASLFSKLQPLFSNARDTLEEPVKGKRSRDWLNKVAVIQNNLRVIQPKILPRIFDVVSEAVYKEVLLALTYQNRKHEVKDHIVIPLGLVQNGGRLFLICQYQMTHDIRSLALNRIQKAKIVTEKGSYIPVRAPKGFTLQAYLADKPFNEFEDTIKTVHLSFKISNPEGINDFIEMPFNETQRITMLKDGEAQIDVDIEDSLHLHGFLETWKKPWGLTDLKKTVISTRKKKY